MRKPRSYEVDPRGSFVRLAEKRVSTTLYRIERLGKLVSSHRKYDYTAADIDAIEAYLRSGIEQTMQRFRSALAEYEERQRKLEAKGTREERRQTAKLEKIERHSEYMRKRKLVHGHQLATSPGTLYAPGNGGRADTAECSCGWKGSIAESREHIKGLMNVVHD